MKISVSSFITLLLTFTLTFLTTGCGRGSIPFWKQHSLEDSPPVEVFSAPAAESPAPEENLVFAMEPLETGDSALSFEIMNLSRETTWRVQAMSWLERDKLAAVFADGRQSSSGNVIMAKAVMFDWNAQQEASIITLPDVTVNRIDQVDDTLFFYDSTTIYTVDSQDFSLKDTAPNAAGSAARGNLLLRRDDSGVVLENLLDEEQNTRVARNDDTGIYGSQMLWAPDGQRFLITRQNLTNQSGNGLLIGNREGEFLREFDVKGSAGADEYGMVYRYEFTPYWSADSRSILIADSSSLRSYNAGTGEPLGQVSSALYGSVNNVRDVYANYVVVCKPAGKGWVTALLDLSTGESTDLLETTQVTDARFSPDGSRIAIIEKENARQVHLLTL